MANAIKVNGKKLQWQDGSGNLRQTQGEIIQTTASFPARSFKVSGNTVRYKDENNNIRQPPSVLIGSTSLNAPKAIKIASSGSLRILNASNVEYAISEGEPPTQVPSNVSVSAPVSVFMYPYDAQVTWSNTNTVDEIIVRWYRNGNFLESFRLSAGNTSNTTSTTYFSQGDQIRADVSYVNDFGEGQSASGFLTA